MNTISILYDTNTLVEHLNTGHTDNVNETSKNSTILNLLLSWQITIAHEGIPFKM